jgi:hypothetical protein
MLQYGLAVTMTTLSVLGMAFTAVAAPYTPKSSQCYGACTAKCAAQHYCERFSAKLFVGLSVTGRSPASGLGLVVSWDISTSARFVRPLD